MKNKSDLKTRMNMSRSNNLSHKNANTIRNKSHLSKKVPVRMTTMMRKWMRVAMKTTSGGPSTVSCAMMVVTSSVAKGVTR